MYSFAILVDFLFTFYLLFGAAVAGRRHSLIAPVCFLNCWLFTLINYFFSHTQLANFVWLRARSLTIDIVHIDVGRALIDALHAKRLCSAAKQLLLHPLLLLLIGSLILYFLSAFYYCVLVNLNKHCAFFDANKTEKKNCYSASLIKQQNK